MHKEHTQVVLNKHLPELGLESGDIGVVVHVHKGDAAYEVEFMTIGGRTIGVETLNAADLRPASVTAIAHERKRVAV